MMHRQANKPIDLESDLGPITDDDVRDAAMALGLAADAFWASETDRRAEAMKSLRSVDVASCPGSGKTTLLVAKLGLLASRWPYRTRGICVLSHTNVARHEIESRLGGTATGASLMRYPHYVGTIHSFVAQFLAIPWLHSLGLPVKLIDTTIAREHRLRQIPHAYKRPIKGGNRDRMDLLELQSSAYSIADLGISSDRPTFKHIQQACEASSRAGYHTFDEMFMWARDCLARHRTALRALQDRFPIVYVDEAQDCDTKQEDLLHQLFSDDERASVTQRFGDANQAIFNSVQVAASEHNTFPNPNQTITVADSCRFGPNIASLAEPLAVRGDQLIGRGPAHGAGVEGAERNHAVIMFDEETMSQVLPAYGEHLLSQFSDSELYGAVCVAVGLVHHPPPSTSQRTPGHVGHYWPQYAPELAKTDPRPERLVDYIRASHSLSSTRGGEMAPAVEKMAEAVLRGARMVADDSRFGHRRTAHRFITQELEANDNDAYLQSYRELVHRIAVGRDTPDPMRWDTICDMFRQVVQGLTAVETSTPSLDAFLVPLQSEGATKGGGSQQADGTNEYVHRVHGRECRIQLGSIHSVKGQTHTATLVLETFWYAHNLAKLKPWLLGDRRGLDGQGKQQEGRLKVHYVAMTRPTHLLCLAMMRSSFTDGEIVQLMRRGWMIKDLTSSVSVEPPLAEM